jgi:NifU-like protein involved in Fe-S cluster formation/Fe-S cluster biogenesis protein NfuA/bacterioferritin-associated ferredoxin
MAKADLFGEALWDQYSNKVSDRMNNPRNQGEITEEEAKERGGKLVVADFGAESCGDAVRLYWLVDESNDTIIDTKFKSFGCGTAIASSDMMAELCLGKTVDEAVKITNIDVEMALRDDPNEPAVPGQKMHCSPYFMPVQTPKGKVQIGEIKVGDEVAVYSNGTLVNSKVKRVISYKTPKDDLVRVYLKTANDGNPGFYVFTKDHQLLDNSGNWVFAEDLKDGDVVSHIHESELRSYSQKFNNRMFNPETAKKTAEKLKESTHFKTEKFAEQYAKLGKPRGSSKGEKNSLEAKYENYFKDRDLPIKFVGDGSFWQWNSDKSSSMNPDFIFENEKKVIEVTTSKLPFREFEEYRKERIQNFDEVGFDCYVIDDLNFNEAEFQNWVHNGYTVSPYRDMSGVHELTPRDWGTIERNGYKIEIDENDFVTVYTLEVEHEAHNYIQNGVISKNCSVMAYDVIKEAAAIYKGVEADSFERENIVCECARISLSTLKEVIKLNDLKTVEEITDYTKAGGFCKSCIKEGGHEEKDVYLVDILKDVRAEMDEEKLKEAANASATGDFSKMTMVQRIKAIDAVIDDSVRQFLIADGGNMEVIDIRDNEPYVDVYIRYLGACSTCATSTTGTLYAIETTLKEKLYENIRVLPI